MPPRVSPRFITELISGDRQLSISQMQKVARLLNIEPTNIPLREPLTGSAVETQIIEKMIRKYGINYVPSRAVTLFDIVGFSLLTPTLLIDGLVENMPLRLCPLPVAGRSNTPAHPPRVTP